MGGGGGQNAFYCPERGPIELVMFFEKLHISSLWNNKTFVACSLDSKFSRFSLLLKPLYLQILYM